jgi:hypothetical protein
VIDPIAGVEEASVDGHERVVKVALQGSVSVGVDDLEGVWVGDRHVVWGEAYEGSCERNEEEAWVSSGSGWNKGDVNYCGRHGPTVFLVQFMNDLRPVTPGSHSTEPSICKLGKPRSRNGSHSMRVNNIWNQMDR